MDKNENQLQEQEAPVKNTDNAFVRVSKDGTPSIPETKTDEKKDEVKKDSSKTTDR